MAIHKDISFFRGEDVLFPVEIDEDPVPDITTWQITFTARKNAGDGDPASIAKSVGGGIAITDGPGGKFEVAIADTDTTTLTPGSYVYDIKRMDAGAEAVLVEGALELKADVTR